MSDAELALQRAGFRWGGLDIWFGAEIRAYSNNELILQTNVSWTDVATSQRISPVPSAAAAAVDSASAVIEGSGVAIGAELGQVTLVNRGQTAFVQSSYGAIRNIVVNVASNVSLRQEIDVRLDLSGYAPFSNAIGTARIASSLARVVEPAPVR